jgi:outer membrane protein TolC
VRKHHFAPHKGAIEVKRACAPRLPVAHGNTPPSRHMTLQEAVELALKHNHDVRIAGYTVEEKQHTKEAREELVFSIDTK